MKPQIKNIPKKIYLNLGFDKDELLQDEDFKDLNYHGEITWCEDKINDTDIEYTLKPVEPAKGLTDEEIEEWANEYVIPDTIPTNAAFIGFKDGAKWARSRMQSDLREELIKFFNQFDRDFLYSDLSTEYIIDEYLNSKRKIR